MSQYLINKKNFSNASYKMCFIDLRVLNRNRFYLFYSDSSVQFSSVYYLSSNTGTSLKIKNKIQINLQYMNDKTIYMALF